MKGFLIFVIFKKKNTIKYSILTIERNYHQNNNEI